jgi:hypothetical protein
LQIAPLAAQMQLALFEVRQSLANLLLLNSQVLARLPLLLLKLIPQLSQRATQLIMRQQPRQSHPQLFGHQASFECLLVHSPNFLQHLLRRGGLSSDLVLALLHGFSRAFPADLGIGR